MKPRYIILFLICISIPLNIKGAITNDLYSLALDSFLGYIGQGIFVYYSTNRVAWELSLGFLAIGIAIWLNEPHLQFLGRLVFIVNGGYTAWVILKEKGF